MQLLRAIRPINLLFVCVTQYLFYKIFIAKPAAQFDIVLRLGDKLNFIFIGITLLITASGYLINDYFDRDIDLINKPNKAFLSQTQLLGIYFLSVFSGFVLAVYIANLKYTLPYLTFYLSAVGGLFIYSSFLKGHAVWGNLMIAGFIASALLIYYIAEYDYFLQLKRISKQYFQNVSIGIIFIAAFSFLINWIREIAKDLEDIIGDRKFQLKTMPIVWGTDISVNIMRALALALLLLFIMWNLSGNKILVKTAILSQTFSLATFILLALLIFVLFQSKLKKQHYSLVSKMCKIIMLVGLTTVFYHYFLIL